MWIKIHKNQPFTYINAQVKHIIKGKSAPHDISTPTAAAVRWLQVSDEDAGQRLDNFLMRHLKGVPKTHVYRIIRSGEVRINKGRCSADTRVQSGDSVRVPPVRMAEKPANAPAAPGGSFPSCLRTSTSWPSTSPPVWRCMVAVA